jgi:hypothetical protein
MNDARNRHSQIDLMRQFVQRKLEPWPELVAALIVGSIAHDEGRPDSDVDCILVFDPLDEAIVPAEFVWIPDTDSYHTIFEGEASEAGGIQIDAMRVALGDFRHQEWPESFRHELAHALVLVDRHQSVARIIEKRAAYPESLRLARIQEHAGWASYFMEEWRLLSWLERGGIASAHDQLTAALEEVIKLLHAYNGEWLPWRYRWMISAQRLPWQPEEFSQKAVEITSHVEPTRESVLKRRAAIGALLDNTMARLQSEGLLAGSDEAFIATHPGLGYDHNFEAWREAHQALIETKGVPGNLE